MSTLHVKPLSGPGNLAADEPHEHSESCTTPFPNSKVALASTLWTKCLLFLALVAFRNDPYFNVRLKCPLKSVDLAV